MTDYREKFPEGTRVRTPLGTGLVIGYVHRIIWEIIVSLDAMPLDTFDHGGVVISVYSFRPGNLEVLKNEK
jgi:hypothetical protein